VEAIVAVLATEARRQLYRLIEKVNDDQEAVEIISTKGRAFLVPEEQWRSIQETRYLLRSPANAKALLESIEQLRSGKLISKTMDELLAMERDTDPKGTADGD
jgi:antitoxin YefM